MSSHPPKPRFALNVGVIGHRPNRLAHEARDRVSRRVDEVLAAIVTAAERSRQRHGSLFGPGAPSVRLLSALAEGADRIGAFAAADHGLALSAVLPFPVDDYERDFEQASSREEYRRLLDIADNHVVLCGGRHDEPRAYEAAGETILQNSDIVLAVWDGGGSAGRGGTTELLDRAAAEGLPIVHVDAAGRAPTRILWAGLAQFPSGSEIDELPSAAVDAMADVVDQIVRPPARPEEMGKLSALLASTWKPRNWRLEMPALLTLLGLRRLRRSDFLPPQPSELAVAFHELGRAGQAHQARDPEPELAPAASAYAWADALAVRYAQTFRSAYSLNFLLAAFAVLLAAVPLVTSYLWNWPKWPFVLLEVFLILSIIGNTVLGRRNDWHGWWLETRELAERMRAGLPPWLLGTRPWGSVGPEHTWTGWYSRAHFRAIAPRPTVFDDAELLRIKHALARAIEDQFRYHERTRERFRTIEHRIECIGASLFALTLLVALAYLGGIAAGLPAPTGWSYTVTALTAALPAFGAASYGVRLVGDFEGTAERSEQTRATLDALNRALHDAPASLKPLRRIAAEASEAMLGDVSHWRLSSETRKLELPG